MCIRNHQVQTNVLSIRLLLRYYYTALLFHARIGLMKGVTKYREAAVKRKRGICRERERERKRQRETEMGVERLR